MFINLKKNNMEYINITMKSINDLTDRLYEALCDNDYNDVNKSISELIALLKDVNSITKEEI